MSSQAGPPQNASKMQSQAPEDQNKLKESDYQGKPGKMVEQEEEIPPVYYRDLSDSKRERSNSKRERSRSSRKGQKKKKHRKHRRPASSQSSYSSSSSQSRARKESKKRRKKEPSKLILTEGQVQMLISKVELLQDKLRGYEQLPQKQLLTSYIPQRNSSRCVQCQKIVRQILPALNKKGQETKMSNAIYVGGSTKAKRFAMLPCKDCYRSALYSFGEWCDTIKAHKTQSGYSHLLMLLPSFVFSGSRQARFDQLIESFGDMFAYDIVGNELYLRLCISTKGHSNYVTQNNLVITQYFKAQSNGWVMVGSLSNLPSVFMDKAKALTQIFNQPKMNELIDGLFKSLTAVANRIPGFILPSGTSAIKDDWNL